MRERTETLVHERIAGVVENPGRLAFIGVGLYIMLLGGIYVGYVPGAGIMALLVGGVVVGVGVLILRSMLR